MKNLSALNLPRSVREFLENIKKNTLPTPIHTSEEEQAIRQWFADETDVEILEGKGQTPEPVQIVKVNKETKFFGFLDGVQKTILFRYHKLPSGALVPIHISHIAVGVVLRDEKGKLFIDKDLISSRLLILAPFVLLKETTGLSLELPNDVMWDNDKRTFSFPPNINEWVLCDTSFRSTLDEREEKSGRMITEEDLYNIGLMRSRARWRAASLRQRMELAMLSRYKKKYHNEWLLMDGPLFLLDIWRRQIGTLFASELSVKEEDVEDTLFNNVVGFIKTHRLRPPPVVLEQIFNLTHGKQRTFIMRILKEVDRKEQYDDPEAKGEYGGAHITWYTSFLDNRFPRTSALAGIVRLDVHRKTFGLERIDYVSDEIIEEIQKDVDAITLGVIRENCPFYQQTSIRETAQPYPISMLEKILKSRLLPARFLSHILEK